MLANLEVTLTRRTPENRCAAWNVRAPADADSGRRPDRRSNGTGRGGLHFPALLLGLGRPSPSTTRCSWVALQPAGTGLAVSPSPVPCGGFVVSRLHKVRAARGGSPRRWTIRAVAVEGVAPPCTVRGLGQAGSCYPTCSTATAMVASDPRAPGSDLRFRW